MLNNIFQIQGHVFIAKEAFKQTVMRSIATHYPDLLPSADRVQKAGLPRDRIVRDYVQCLLGTPYCRPFLHAHLKCSLLREVSDSTSRQPPALAQKVLFHRECSIIALITKRFLMFWLCSSTRQGLTHWGILFLIYSPSAFQ